MGYQTTPRASFRFPDQRRPETCVPAWAPCLSLSVGAAGLLYAVTLMWLLSDDVAAKRAEIVRLTSFDRPDGEASCADARAKAVAWSSSFFADRLAESRQTWLNAREHEGDARFGLLPPHWHVPLRLYGSRGLDGHKFLFDLGIAASNRSCSVVSVGSNLNLDFEGSVVEVHSACRVSTFDCTVTSEDVGQVIRNLPVGRDRVSFEPTCVGEDGVETAIHSAERGVFKTKTKSLATLLRRQQVDVLKFDAEGAEVIVLPALLASGAPLPRQLSLEAHMWGGNWASTEQTLRLFQALFTAGYVLAGSEINPMGRHCCMEFTLLLGCGLPWEPDRGPHVSE